MNVRLVKAAAAFFLSGCCAYTAYDMFRTGMRLAEPQPLSVPIVGPADYWAEATAPPPPHAKENGFLPTTPGTAVQFNADGSVEFDGPGDFHKEIPAEG